MTEVTRRDFMQSSSAAVGLGLTVGLKASAQGKGSPRIRLGLVGGGARGQQLLRDGLLGSEDFDVVAVADTYRPNLHLAEFYARLANAGVVMGHGEKPTPEQRERVQGAPPVETYGNFREMLAARKLDAIIIATPPLTHKPMLLSALEAGLHVFCETPMATSVADARAIVQAAHASDRIVQIGHQRRYHPNYNLVLKHLHAPYPFGRPIHIETYDHKNTHDRRGFSGGQDVDPEARRQAGRNLDAVVNWRNYADAGGSPCLEALPRSIDTANWFCGAVPARVFAFGGIEYWRDGRTVPDNLTVLFEYRMDPENSQFVRLESRYTRQDQEALNRAYTLRATFSYSRCSDEHGIHERVISDHATALLNPAGDSLFRLDTMASSSPDLRNEHRKMVSGELSRRLAAMTEAERKSFVVTHGGSYDLPGYRDGPGTTAPIKAQGSEESAEVHQFRAFARHIREGGEPRANVMVGLAAVVAGAHARQSLETGMPVAIDPALMAFDFETLSVVGFDETAKPIPGSMEVL